MNNEMNMSYELTKKQNPSYAIQLLWIVLGSALLSIAAQIAFPLPFSPIPISLQTLAVAILAMTLGPVRASLSVVAYLCQASLGLPVTVGGIPNPLWMVGPTAGYLIGFLISSYAIGKLLSNTQYDSFLKLWLKLSINETIILSFGTLWLSFFLGFQEALYIGLIPFIPGALLKITMATSLYRPIGWLKTKI